MSDMYEKLGNLLNNVLETGEIPQEEINKDQIPTDESIGTENSGPFSFNNQNNPQEKQENTKKTNESHSKIRINYTNNKEIPVGSVIKDFNNVNMHKYTNLMHIPCIVSKSLDTLNIVCINNLTVDSLRKQYHKILRENHPDTSNKKGIFHSPEELKNAYEIVKNYFFS